jgi:predicted lipoprotein with Yx(FWY)xxD motif
MPTKPLAVLAALAALALIALGCGSSDDSSTSTSSTTATTATSASGGGKAAVTIDVADNPDLGQILTDGDGNTVYLFEKDESDESYCSGDCATAWPPVTTSGDATAGSGADQSLISTIQRDDGTEQVTYDGHPLYLYAGDSKPGDTAGNGLDQFGAEWYALTPDGSNAEDSESTESSGSSDDSTDDSTEDSTSTGGGYSTY